MDQSDLQELLETYAPNVYFQPPPKAEIQYPCIIYSRDAGDTKFANNKVYVFTQRYLVTVVDRNPLGDIREKVAYTDQTLYVRGFVKDGLNHDVFTLYW